MFEAVLDYIKNLPTEPGVYRMRNAAGDVLYVGKAVNLKNRVASYFKGNTQSVKTDALVSQITSIEVTVTRSEVEALLLESSLIKALRPKYNVLMRDDKSYPYLHLNLQHAFPSLKAVRCKKKPQEKGYFGPYPGLQAVRETLNLIQKIFKLRNCTTAFFNARARPCLQYQLKRCTAPCTGLIANADYALAVQEARFFLQGKSLQVIQRLEARMQAAVAKLAFEEAAVLRDQIKSLRHIQEQQHMVRLRGDADVIVMQVRPGFACVQWVMIRQGQVLETQAFFPRVPSHSMDETELPQQVFEGFVTHFYQDNPARIPPLILTDTPALGEDTLASLLTTWRGRACRISARARGQHAEWVEFARVNLQQACLAHNRLEDTQQARYQALQALLGVSAVKPRVVCFDVSHTQGQETVASCVVFDEQGPCKRLYRRFILRDITPGDDYAAMAQVITRYLKRLPLEACPLVMIVDGGKGQISVAQQVLARYPEHAIKLIGIVKGPGRKACFDRLIDAESGAELAVANDSPARLFVQHARDEAHRFAISLHRKKRQKSALSSSLLSIPGVGNKRYQALLHRFGGLRELTHASIDEIVKVPGISSTLAKAIYQHCHR